MKTLLTLTIVLGAIVTAFSQDTLTLINGKQKLIQHFQYSVNDSMQIDFKLHNGKTKSYDRDEIFSISKANAMPMYFYTADSQENNMKKSELILYVNGMTDAHNNYQAPFDFLSAYAVGFATPFATRHFLNPFIPLTYSFTVGIWLPTQKSYVKKHLVGKSDSYKKGFLEVRRKKRLIGNIAGGVLGLASSLLVLQMVGD